MTAVILAIAAAPVFAFGALIAGPIAYRRGRRAAEADAWEIAQILNGRRKPVGHRMTWARSRADYRARIAAWWESTAPRDPRELFAEEPVMGRPPLRLVRSAA